MYNKDAHCYGNVAFPEMTMPMDHECDDHVGGFSHMTCPEMAMPMPMPMPMPMRHEYDDRFYGGCGCCPTCGGCSGCGCECGPTCGCVMDPIVEPMIQRCCQREFVHEVPHL